ncbi:DUF5348 domain-containing protein [Cohnella sp.]
MWTVNKGSGLSSLHCGKCFDLAIGSTWFPCRLIWYRLTSI